VHIEELDAAVAGVQQKGFEQIHVSFPMPLPTHKATPCVQCSLNWMNGWTCTPRTA
jgi:hypothetical protein